MAATDLGCEKKRGGVRSNPSQPFPLSIALTWAPIGWPGLVVAESSYRDMGRRLRKWVAGASKQQDDPGGGGDMLATAEAQPRPRPFASSASQHLSIITGM